MRYAWVIWLMLPWLTGCYKEEEQALPTAGGNLDELMIIVDDADFQQPISDSLIYHFFTPYPGLPQLYEPTLPIKIREWKRYEAASDLFHKYRNLAFVAILSENTPITQFVRQQIGEEAYQKALTDPSTWMVVTHDQFAKPQRTIYLFAPTYEEMYDRLNRGFQQVVAVVKEAENARLHKALFAKGHMRNIETALTTYMGITIEVPAYYSIAMANDTIVWFDYLEAYFDKKENQTKQIRRTFLVQEVLLDDIYASPFYDRYADQSGTVDVLPFAARDLMNSRYIFGRDTTFSPYTDYRQPLFQEQIENGATLSRGLWRMDNPFMGGPFLTVARYTEDSTALLLIDAHVYAAGSDKRPIIREYEAILSSITFP